MSDMSQVVGFALISLILLALCVSGDRAVGEPEVAHLRRQLQEHNRNAVQRLRSLFVDHLSQSPATLTPYPQRPAGRRRRLITAAKPRYASQCLYEPPPSLSEGSEGAPPPPEQEQGQDPGQTATNTTDTDGDQTTTDPSLDETSSTSGGNEQQQQQQGGEDAIITTAASRRRQAQQTDGTPDTPPPTSPSDTLPPSVPPPNVPSQPPPTGTCYLNPMALAHPDFPDPETPLEIMLLKTGWTAYQCSFERREGRCGTYRHEPYDCRWQADTDRCAVPSDYLLPRLLTYLHCRDDTTITPFWDRCYRVGVLNGDSDWCGQSDGNQARCWWFPARTDDEVDLCGPSPGGGVDSRDAYDELVAQMRNGVWLREWFGECPTADLVFTIKSACNYTTADDCAVDASCQLHPDLKPEYGMCRLRDELIWDAMFGAESALFNATVVAMAECAAASAGGQDACLAAGSLLGSDGAMSLDADKFSDVVDLVFIEEVTPGSAGASRPATARTLLLALAAAVVVGWLGGERRARV